MSRLIRHEFDAGYVERLVAEDPDTEQHFARYFGDLLTLKLRSRLRSQAQVDDARQETFVRVLAALKKKGTLSSPQALGSFVNSVCNNVLFETYRAGSRQTQLDDDYDTPAAPQTGIESILMNAEERTRVQEALSDLPARDREVLHLLFFEERDKDAVCQRLKVDRNYLRVLLHRAKEHFRARFADEDRERTPDRRP